MAWVVRRPVMQRWLLVDTTWLRAAWTILLVVLAQGGTQWGGTGMVPGSSQRTSSACLAVAPDRSWKGLPTHTFCPPSQRTPGLIKAFNER